MNIFGKLTIRQMKLNRRRTIVTILGVIISVAMITAVSSFSGSFMDMFRRLTITQTGEYQVAYWEVSAKQRDAIVQDGETAKYYALSTQGLAKLSENMLSKQFVQIKAINPEGFEPAQIQLKEGRLPEQPGELLLSARLLEERPDEYALGQQVTFSLGERFDSRGDPVSPNAYYEREQERFEESGEQLTYTVVGFAEMLPVEKGYGGSYTALTLLDDSAFADGGTADVFVAMKHVDQSIYEHTSQMKKDLGLDSEQMSYNSELLLYSGVNSDLDLLVTFGLVAGILILIIMVGSVALIYNSFAISITERSANFGMLASIGATKRQRRHMVFLEAGLIGLIAIPLGIFFGLLGIGITFRAVSPMLTRFAGQPLDLHLVVVPSALVIAVLFSILTIFISAWVPARRAAKITPISAIRKTQDIKLSPRAVKTSKVTRKVFGFPGELALKNLKRNKKRYRTTLFSLIISLVLFLSACSFTYYMSQAYDQGQDKYEYDIDVRVDGLDVGLQHQLLGELSELPGVDGARYCTAWNAGTSLPEGMFSQAALEGLREEEQIENGSVYANVRFIVPDEQSLRILAEENGVPYESLTDPEHFNAIVINRFVHQSAHNYNDLRLLSAKPGDTLSVELRKEERSEEIDSEGNPVMSYHSVPFEEVDFTIAALSDEGTIGTPDKLLYINSLYLVVSPEVFEAMTAPIAETEEFSSQMEIVSADHVKLTERINTVRRDAKYQNLNLGGYVSDMADQKERYEQMLLVINVFVFGFVALIALIGVANIFNTISTSLVLRKQEFAMLKSVGMTPKGFNRMIRFESLFYGLKTILYGLPIGFAVMVLIYRTLGRNFAMFFTVPWGNVIGGVIAIFLVVALTMAYSSRKMKKENIVDALRNDNL